MTADGPRDLLELARAMCSRFRETYGADLLLAGAYGSAARGTATPWSDLDLCCIIERPADGSRHVLVAGVPVGWRLIGRAALEDHLQHPSPRWPFLMGMLSSLRVLEGDPARLDHWIRLGTSAPPERFTAALEQALPGLVWESYGRILSSRQRRNEREVLFPSVLEVLFEMARALSLLNGRWPRHDYFDHLKDTFEFPILPDDYRPLATALWDSRDPDEITALAGRLVGNFKDLLARRGIRLVDYADPADVPILDGYLRGQGTRQ